MKRTGLALAVAMVSVSGVSAQGTPLPFSDDGWIVQGAGVRVEEFRGAQALRVGNGSAARADIPVQNGTFEFDVSLPRTRGFVGLRFRMDAMGNAEEIYFRAHKSLFPDAIQYAPVFAGESYWQVFHGPAATASVEFPEDGDWLHVRLEVEGRVAAVFLNHGVEPVLVSRLARDPAPGFFAVYAGFPAEAGGSGAEASFANMVVSTESPPTQGLTPPGTPALPPGLINSWEISPSFRWTKGLPTELPDPLWASEEWVDVTPDEDGFVLVGQHRQRDMTGGAMGVVARFQVSADRAESRRLDLGFSDAAGVFLNGHLVYASDHSFSQNFPRRQGLVTLDQASLFLPLQEGENEVLILVVNVMGGWAVGGVLAPVEALPYQAFSAPPGLQASVPSRAPGVGGASLAVDAWREDLDSLVSNVEALHPHPYARLSRDEWLGEVDALKARLPELTQGQIVTEMMALVSLLEDGHTSLSPVGPRGFHGWYPFRVKAFEEGLFLSVLPPEHADLLGARVTRIGELPADEAFRRVARVTPADGSVGKLNDTPMFLAVPQLLQALGVSQGVDSLSLTVLSSDGMPTTIHLPRVAGDFGYGWYWSEFDGPGESSYVAWPEGLSRPLPLHLRNRYDQRQNFWFEVLPESGVVYLQSNAILDAEDETMESFFQRFFQATDTLQDRLSGLVVDLRFNPGGNGYQLPAIMEALGDRPWLTGPGKLLVLTGPKTFSAGVVATAMMKNGMQATLVGSPGAAGFNFFSDMRSRVLPRSKLKLWVATVYWEYDDRGGLAEAFHVDVPVPFPPEAYFSGSDPVLERALSLLGG